MPKIIMLSLWPALLFAANCFFVIDAHAAPSRQSIDESVKRTMETFQVPGMAVSVVYDGSIYYSEGQGVLETGKNQTVDEQTLFQIASVSKAFTAAALALLVDDGKLGWDQPVIDYIPEFRMYDPWVTREFTIRDLLTHRSGLPLGAGDLLMYPEGKSTRQDIIRAMRYLKPSTSFRSTFAYDNLLYVIAGEVIERVSGKPFVELVEQRLFAALGMQDCVASLERVAPDAEQATPHLLIDDELQTTQEGDFSVGAPAGGINCSAASMAKWMMFVLNRGATSEGNQLISSAQFEQLVKPITLVDQPPYMVEHAGSFLGAYALGWNISTFYGQPMFSHGGLLWGMTTYIAILPKQGLAVFASNNLMSPAPRAIVADILDQFLIDTTSEAGKDWVTIFDDAYNAQQEEGAEAVAQAEGERNKSSKPSLSLESYAGTYRDDWYGNIHITLSDDGQLWFSSDRNEPLNGPLEHFQYDTFIARWTDRQLMADAYVSFTLSPEGTLERIRMKAVSPTTDFSYDFHDLDLKRVSQ